jgi:4-phospho-D-threonate 3-dehydrogenase / 4-phospho-D-erythronate 3-dehydrogenase
MTKQPQSQNKRSPLIAITMGDPAGIGAEVALKALSKISSKSKFILLGDYRLWRNLARKFKFRQPLVWVNDAELGHDIKKGVAVLDLRGPKKIQWGKITAANGAAAVHYVCEGARLALAGEVDALVTAPISKEAIHKAGCPFPGHTELLATLSNAKSFAMMMVGGPFRIVLQSIHVSIKDSISSITAQLVWEKLELTHKTLRTWFGVKKPRIAVAGLNPHAGESGAFGKEEIKVLRPVIERAKKLGWDVTGPHPPDTLFYWASKKPYDAILCMYHDQGLIPLKLLAFDSGVNLTLGLPFVRTSPDHGTAFDIAGKGIAKPDSMIAAIQLAESLTRSS